MAPPANKIATLTEYDFLVIVKSRIMTDPIGHWFQFGAEGVSANNLLAFEQFNLLILSFLFYHLSTSAEVTNVTTPTPAGTPYI